MKRLLLLFVLLTTHLAYSQTPELDWIENIYGSGDDLIYSIETTEEGYVYCLVGFEGTLYLPGYPSPTSNGEVDVALVKLNRYGDLMWGKKVGGTKSETPLRLKLLSNDNIILVGGFQYTVDFDPSVNSEDIRVSNGSDDCFALILDPNGNYIHCKTIGGTESDMFLGVDEDGDHNIWISARYKDSIDVEPQGSGNALSAPNGSGSFILKLDQQLNVLKTIPVEGNDYSEIYDLDVSRRDQIHFICMFDDTMNVDFSDTTCELYSNGKTDCFYSIMDTDGNHIEHAQIGSSFFEYPLGISEGYDGTFVMEMMYEDSLPLFIADSLQIISGNTFSPFSNNLSSNTAIIKLENTEVIWCKTINSVNQGHLLTAGDPGIDEYNNVYIASTFYNVCTLNQSGFNDIGLFEPYGGFIAKLSAEGETIRIHTVSGDGYTSPRCIYLDENDLYLTGASSGNNDFDFSENDSNPIFSGGFIAKYNLQNPFLFTNELSETETVLYPNPTDQVLNLQVPKASNLIIHDLSGREIEAEYNFDGESYLINTSQLVNGVYTLSFDKGESRLAERFVVQH
ncbi:MAG: T9SS type A sorting domain-containing protein [Crocinitomicaceae bacterium]|nr:T9SS type A sorting domain-containing protein [Crocinitomicaceae bacterium]